MEDPNLITKAIDKLLSKLKLLNFQNLNISECCRNYLIKYLDNYSFYMSLYSQLLQKAFKKLDKPVSESTFIDYGGGCGILSFLAKEIGFGTVVYSDVFQISVNEAQLISRRLNITIDYYICGEVKEFTDKINLYNIRPDLICSFDVLEHIYDLESWIKTIADIETEFSLLFMTSANPCNPFIANRLKKMHIKSENKGFENNIRCNDMYLNTSSLEERERIIRNKFPDLKNDDIKRLALESRGLIKNDIEKVVCDYIKTGNIFYKIKHPTNTCDPYTGSWTEKLIDLKQLKIFIKDINLTVNISNSFYSYSDKKIINVFKYLLNQIIRVLGPKNLFFSPAFILEIQKPLTQNGLS
ncbi:MAG: class I SAM-dependent methyltransferase [Bacteroidales bacterium]|nr:class I SAM-dependent methyltransferase [Bacteroidales bacterium]